MIDLGTLGGTFGLPSALNNRGQVVGQSNLAGDQPGNSDPFLWDGEKLLDLFTDSTGGNPLNAMAINDAGEVVGAAAFPNLPAFHAYVWRKGVATDLGAIAGDGCSEAFAINSGGQVVGQSFACDGSVVHTFLWENGSMVDLNTLIPGRSNLQLVEAVAINDRGEIAGDGLPPGCGIVQGDAQCGHAFVLVPRDADSAGMSGSQENSDATAADRNTAVPVAPARTTAPQPNWTPSEVRDRARALLAKRNRRFGSLPPK
jgi:probable HAF family extracellular repeat protein